MQGLLFSANVTDFMDTFSSVGDSLESNQNQIQGLYRKIEMRDQSTTQTEAGVALSFF